MMKIKLTCPTIIINVESNKYSNLKYAKMSHLVFDEIIFSKFYMKVFEFQIENSDIVAN